MRQQSVASFSTQYLQTLTEKIKRHTWEYRQKPFRILNNIYYVGNQWVGAYLIDTGDGLILLDSNFQEVFWLLLDNIYSLGFRPQDIKLLLLTHGHFDHIGGARYIQELSSCKTYFPKEDLFFLRERRDLLYGEVPEFQIHEVYNENTAISLGNTTLVPVHTPGHTPGCTSILFHSQYEGKDYLVAVHGGLGQNGLTKQELRKNGLPVRLQQDYLTSLQRLVSLPVDVFLPLHNSYYDILSLAKEDDGSGRAFIRPNDWRTGMETRIAMFQELLSREPKA